MKGERTILFETNKVRKNLKKLSCRNRIPMIVCWCSQCTQCWIQFQIFTQNDENLRFSIVSCVLSSLDAPKIVHSTEILTAIDIANQTSMNRFSWFLTFIWFLLYVLLTIVISFSLPSIVILMDIPYISVKSECTMK